ncbi:hypothetical protein BCR34DRAFT_565739 [Clohesyomyces aquaticus]|uniref:Uncharacterized protein n=1 Tax=Clohesyomyces aquaticus TaxID=1231657 RepID=A0A1Y1ZLN1_9PLEO|nr:hypothetical protein BCR34DRAFT_565739 [Clohesyomyces aquaticus]
MEWRSALAPETQEESRYLSSSVPKLDKDYSDERVGRKKIVADGYRHFKKDELTEVQTLVDNASPTQLDYYERSLCSALRDLVDWSGMNHHSVLALFHDQKKSRNYSIELPLRYRRWAGLLADDYEKCALCLVNHICLRCIPHYNRSVKITRR